MVEEVARARLDDVPFTLPARRAMFGALTAGQRLRRRIENLLTGLGLTETYTPSLRPDDANPQALRLPEPISAELAVLRTSLLPSLVEAVRRNVELGAEHVALFEIARVYLPAREPARRGDARRRDRRGRLAAGEGDRRHALRRAEGRAELRARRARAAAPRQVGGDRGRRGRRAPPGRARRRLGRVRARPGEAARGRARGGALHRRRLVPAGPPGSRLRRGGGGERRRARRRRARGRRRGAARAAALRRLPRRAGRARAASRSPSRPPSSRPSGR